MSREELLKEIMEMASDEDILQSIPELKKQRGADGKESYTYNTDAGDARLTDLDKAALRNLSDRIYEINNKLTVESVNEQMEIIRANRAATQLPPQPPRGPSSNIPPKPPPGKS